MPISAPEPLLEISGLSAGYGKIGVLQGIDLTVGKAEPSKKARGSAEKSTS